MKAQAQYYKKEAKRYEEQGLYLAKKLDEIQKDRDALNANNQKLEDMVDGYKRLVGEMKGCLRKF